MGQPAGVLEDYGAVAEAFCAVHQLTGEGMWLSLAGELLDSALARFRNGQGGFFDTPDDAEPLVTRPADPTDNAIPSGQSALCAALVTYAALTGETSYREAAATALSTLAPIVASHARFTGYACAVAEALQSGPYEIAVVTDDPVGDPLVADRPAAGSSRGGGGGRRPRSAGSAATGRPEPPRRRQHRVRVS